MYKKTVSWWRLLRTPMLLASTSALVFGCASHNPLIDESDEAEDTIVSTVDTDEQTQVRQPVQTPIAQQKTADVSPSEQGTANQSNSAESHVATTNIKAAIPATATQQTSTPVATQTKPVAKEKLAAPVTKAKIKKQSKKKQATLETEQAEPATTTQQAQGKDSKATTKPLTSTPVVAVITPQSINNTEAPRDENTTETEATEQSATIDENVAPPQLQVEQYSQAIPATDKELTSEENTELNEKPTGMKKWLKSFTPYKTDIQQGNFVSSEMIEKIQSGMTKEQVRFVLGTPLLTDMFHKDRWDYVFRLQKQDGTVKTSRVTVLFTGNYVSTILADPLPDETQYLQEITTDDKELEKEVKKIREERQEQEAKEGKVVPAESRVVENEADEDEDIQKVEEAATREQNVDSGEQNVQTQKVKEVVVPEKRPVSQTQQQKPYTSVDHRTPAPQPSAKSTPQPQHVVAEPINVSTPVSSTEAETAPKPEAPIAKRARRTVYRDEAPQQVEEDDEDIDGSSSNKVRHYKPISIPNRIEKMVPETPNDKLIGNIQ